MRRYHPRIINLAKRLVPRCLPTVDLQDLIQVGRIAVIRVARRFDPSFGVPFGGYLQQRLRGAMLDLLDSEYGRYFNAPRDGQWNYHLKRRVEPLGYGDPEWESNNGLVAEAEDIIEGLEDRVSETPERQAIVASMQSFMATAAELSLTPRQEIIRKALFEDDLTLEQAGLLIGVGESRACQIRTEILTKMRDRLRLMGVTRISQVLP